MTEDKILLQQYAGTRDAEAFAQLVARYSDMVYATCLRITDNPHDAEDAGQECFLALARNAGSIRSSLPGWLHATARNASFATVKGERKHKEREAAMAHTDTGGDGPTWADMAPHIDAAIQDLPQELQSPIILHYLQGKSQSEIAGIIGADQSTVSRRLNKGVNELRKRLQKAGVVVSVAVLASCLAAGSAEAAPAAFKAALGKMALAGVGKGAGTAATSSVATGAILGTAKAKIIAAVVVGAIVVGGVVAVEKATEEKPEPPAPVQVAAQPEKETEMKADDQMADEPRAIMYTNMSERDFIKWNLGYTIPLIASLTTDIPEDQLWRRPSPSIDPPGWTLACFVNEENKVISFLRKEPADIPEKFGLFTECPSRSSTISADRLDQLRGSDITADELLLYCKTVRARTDAYVDSIDGSDLKEVPDRGAIENYDPIREEFVKLIWMQNFVLGKLVTVSQIIAGEAHRVDRPEFEASGKLWDSIQIQKQGRTMLKDMSHQGRWVSYMGTLVSCARYLDKDVQESWLWGGCGYAFSLTIHEELCPSGPYMPVGHFDELLPGLGIDLEQYSASPADETFAQQREEFFAAACKAIDAGHPVIGWSLDTIDWYPICGYDEKGNYVFLWHDGKPRTFAHAELGDRAPGGMAILSVVNLKEPANDAEVVREALLFALGMAAGNYSKDDYQSGFAGYDTWIRALSNPAAPIQDGTCFGHSFNAACWSECRHHAVAFLEEANRRLDQEELTPLLDEAARHYRVVADQFESLTKLFPCQPGDMEPMKDRFNNADLRREAVRMLTDARSAELSGIQVIAEIATKLGADNANALLAKAMAAGSSPARQ